MNRKVLTQAYWVLRLLNLPRVGNAKVRKILDFCRAGGFTVSEFIERILRGAEKTILLEPDHLDELGEKNGLIDEQWESLQEANIKPLLFGSEQYPTSKMNLLNNRAPVLLFAKGNLNLLEKASLGFCGSRKASEKGLKTAWDIADQMARKGVNIVSGYASGVDMASHKAAVEAGGSTTIVLAEGILNFRIKKPLREIYNDEEALVISEFLPKLPWSVHNAMQRNSTICALSDAMVLIEAEERGGSISAGRVCLDMKLPLFAPVYGGMPKSAVGNRILLNKGARELKKNRNTGRANMIQVEQILFGRKDMSTTYPIEKASYQSQLSFFEGSAGYNKARENN